MCLRMRGRMLYTNECTNRSGGQGLQHVRNTSLFQKTAAKEEIYRALLPQIEAVISGVDDLIANLANVAAILKTAFNFHWVGFYRVTAPQILTLGPFQGPLACVNVPLRKACAEPQPALQENAAGSGRGEIPWPYCLQQPVRNRKVLYRCCITAKLNSFSISTATSLMILMQIDQKYLEQIIGLIRLQNYL